MNLPRQVCSNSTFLFFRIIGHLLKCSDTFAANSPIVIADALPICKIFNVGLVNNENNCIIRSVIYKYERTVSKDPLTSITPLVNAP